MHVIKMDSKPRSSIRRSHSYAAFGKFGRVDSDLVSLHPRSSIRRPHSYAAFGKFGRVDSDLDSLHRSLRRLRKSVATQVSKMSALIIM